MAVSAFNSNKMDCRTWILIYLIVAPTVTFGWRSSFEDQRDRDRRIHYHSKRHMRSQELQPKKRPTTKPREIRKKPVGHLPPLEEDDMENDEVVSVAIGPPPIRPKYEKIPKKIKESTTLNKMHDNSTATNLVKDVLTQLGREFLAKKVDENFIFGQYVGSSMKNLTSALRLSLQHEILEAIVKYQKTNRGENTEVVTGKDVKVEKKHEKDQENWPDFSNLEKIV